jgi:putative Holliday junction resolvase
MRVMAVDPGAARVGLAVSDETETLATPLRVIRGGAGIEGRIAGAAGEVGAGRIVVGLAVGLDGAEGPGAQQARDLADNLARVTGLPVELWDERFTTELALRLRRSARPAGPQGHKARAPGRSPRTSPDDAAAAAVLLQSYLDRAKVTL